MCTTPCPAVSHCTSPPPKRVRRKIRYLLVEVHAPAVFAAEVLAHLPTCQRCLRPELHAALWVSIVVVGAKKKGVHGIPGETQGLDAEDGVLGHGVAFLR